MSREENALGSDTETPLGDAAAESSEAAVKATPSLRPEKSAVSGESCSLMPTLDAAAMASERNVHWNKKFIKKDDLQPEAAAGASRAAVDSLQRLEGGCSELENQLRDEVRRRVSGTASRLASVAEHAFERAGKHVAGLVKEERADVVLELQRQNAKLQRELDYLNKANGMHGAIQHLKDVQDEIKALGDKVGKLQDEVHERRTAHCRELQRRQAEVRKLVHRCEASRAAVQAARKENQALREHLNRAQTQAQRADARPAPGGDELQAKLSRARGRLQRAERELEEKKHHPKKVAHSVDSLQTLELVWSEHVTLLESLARRQQQWSLLRDRVELFARNIDILRVENDELAAKLADVHVQLKDFVDRPMLPSAVVERNVALLQHMETIEATLAERAVELDEQESELMLEQNKVRELLVMLEGLRRENRHLSRRLQKFGESHRSPEEGEGRSDGSGKGSSTASSRNRLEMTSRRTPLGNQNISMFLIPHTEASRPHIDAFRDDQDRQQEEDQDESSGSAASRTSLVEQPELSTALPPKPRPSAASFAAFSEASAPTPTASVSTEPGDEQQSSPPESPK